MEIICGRSRTRHLDVDYVNIGTPAAKSLHLRRLYEIDLVELLQPLQIRTLS